MLRRLCSQTVRVFRVLNKADRLTASELAEAAAFTRTVLTAELGTSTSTSTSTGTGTGTGTGSSTPFPPDRAPTVTAAPISPGFAGAFTGYLVTAGPADLRRSVAGRGARLTLVVAETQQATLATLAQSAQELGSFSQTVAEADRQRSETAAVAAAVVRPAAGRYRSSGRRPGAGAAPPDGRYALTRPSPELPDSTQAPAGVDELRELPLDPDLDGAAQRAPGPAAGPSGAGAAGRRSRWPRVQWRIVGAVAGGGFAGGVVRYGAGLAWPTRAGTVPWSTFGVNTAGAFILALLLVLVLDVLPPTTYLRPVLGTGFCGALTTFSSVVTAVDQLAVHGQPGLAAGYLAASLAAGLAAASFGVLAGRSIAAYQQKGEG